MTKENLIPKTEIVQELKSEIPSYEEFLKTYEVDENVASSYHLENQKSRKSYGPCSPSYCSNCSCSRSDCNCKSGEGWTELYVSCPAIGCGSSEFSYWVHSTDSYRTWISNQARIRCSKSYCSTYHIKNWRFGCSRHVGEYYREVNRKSFSKALGLVLQNGDYNKVITELGEYIITHKSEWDD